MKRVAYLLCIGIFTGGWSSAQALVDLPRQSDTVPWPTEKWPEAEPADDVDREQLSALIDKGFSTPYQDNLPGTRALLVVHRGRLVVERYADGFGPGRRFLSQSMAKSVTGALVGILVGQGRLGVDDPAPVPEWQQEGDERRAITLNHLMTMSSGLAFNEAYFNPLTSDVLPMLFGYGRTDMGAFAVEAELADEPGSVWHYASGTANIISRIIRDKVGGTADRYLDFMRDELFDVIGMRSAEPEFDESGTFVGSSWLHATARDWARFGLFILRDGVWKDRRVLPEGWVDYVRSPLSHDERRTYGALFWLNVGNAEKGFARRIPNASADVFLASGHRGQLVVMVPSKDLVVVRLGRTPYTHYPDLNLWIGEIITTFPDVEAR